MNAIPFPDWRERLQKRRDGPKKTLTNLILYLRNIPSLGRNLKFNELTHQAEWNGKPIDDGTLIEIRLVIEAEGFQPNDRDIRGAVESVARRTRYSPIVDYLDGLGWDGEPRLDRWMVQHLGAEATPLAELISAKVLIAAIARAKQPGCQVDTMLVIEGPQGIRKSSGIKALFGEQYTAESVNLFDQHNKMVLGMMGSWAVELAEFVAIAKGRQDKVKGLISTRQDKVVLPYAKFATTHPRRCVFIGTINPGDAGYLSDTTGNRRYWPVTATAVDIDGIAASRDQLWAEANHRYEQGERWWLEREEEKAAISEQSHREELETWAEPLAEKILAAGGLTEITSSQALSLLGMDHDRKDKKAEMRVAKALRDIGFIRQVERVEDATGVKRPRRMWRRA